MTEDPDEFNQLVQQKMQARAERHALERQAEAEQQGQEARAVQAVQAQTEHAQQQRAVERQRQEVAAEARRRRPAYLAQFRLDPAGLRHVITLREVCLRCGSERIRTRADNAPHVFVCSECSTEWYASACWSCTTGMLDSRDPETAPCAQCRWPKCAVCGACSPQGCSTNPYTTGNRQRDEVPAQEPPT